MRSKPEKLVEYSYDIIVQAKSRLGNSNIEADLK